MSIKQRKDNDKLQRGSADKQSGTKGSSQQSGNKGSSQQSGTPGGSRQGEHEEMQRDIKRQTGQNTPGRKTDDRPE